MRIVVHGQQAFGKGRAWRRSSSAAKMWLRVYVAPEKPGGKKADPLKEAALAAQTCPVYQAPSPIARPESLRAVFARSNPDLQVMGLCHAVLVPEEFFLKHSRRMARSISIHRSLPGLSRPGAADQLADHQGAKQRPAFRYSWPETTASIPAMC